MRRFNISKVYFGASRRYGIYAQLTRTRTRETRAHAHICATYATVIGGRPRGHFKRLHTIIKK